MCSSHHLDSTSATFSVGIIIYLLSLVNICQFLYPDAVTVKLKVAFRAQWMQYHVIAYRLFVLLNLCDSILYGLVTVLRSRPFQM